MKHITLLIALLIAGTAFGATPQPELYPPYTGNSVQGYHGGEHLPIQWTGRVELRNAVVSTTEWFQVGFTTAATTNLNENIGRYNPEKFTIDMNLRWARAAADSTWLCDSAYVRNAWWEHRWDTTASSSSLNGEVRRNAWPLDSLNYFVKNGAYNGGSYIGNGGWQAESFGDVAADTVYTWQAILRFWEGGYYRLNFESTSTDTFYIDYKVTGEH